MAVPLLDLSAHHRVIRAEIDAAIAAVIDSERYILGPVVERFEAQCATYCGTRHALGVSSGTDALLVSLMAAGIGPGDEVITTAFTFFATGGCISRVGATPVFADIDPKTYNIDPDDVAHRVTERTRAIIPVHLFGQCADMDRLVSIAKTNDLVVIEDAAQAIGAERGGRRAGSMGDYGCFSFFPSKNLGGFGDGGLVTTTDPERFALLRKLRGHGASPKYFHALIGGNFRLDALQAAVLEVKLRHLDAATEQRQANAARYDDLLGDLQQEGLLKLPFVEADGRHIWNQYTVRVEGGRRNALRDHLRAKGIGTEIYYPRPLHLQECFAELGGQAGDLPHTEAAAAEVLSIPIFPELTEAQQTEVADAVRAGLSAGAGAGR